MDDHPLAEMSAEWARLRNDNVGRLARLAAQGVQLDCAQIVNETRLEHILRAVAGEEGVLASRIDAQRRIAGMLDDAESQVRRATLLAPSNGKGH